MTLTATVGITAPGSGTPTGTVTFKDGNTKLGTAKVNGSGTATLNAKALSTGAHTITASYGGDKNFAAGSSTLAQTVDQAATNTTLTAKPSPSSFGQSVTFTVTVSSVAPGCGKPTGIVTFLDGTSTLGTANLNGSGKATFSTKALGTGAHTITASYGGDRKLRGRQRHPGSDG